MAFDKKKKNKPVRQDWHPPVLLDAPYKILMAALSVFKIVLGALATVLIICLACGFVFAGLLGDYLQNDILPSAEMELPGTGDVEQTSYLHYVDRNGEIQRLQQVYTDVDREWVSFEDIPQELINATIAVEDKRFYEHQGVDWITTIKACARMFFGDDSVGGSSITQQLVKNVKQEKSITVQRKVLEIFRAAQLEKKYDKDVIMEHYLNTIFLGNGCYGVKTAAAHYFGKELELLTVAECASLISITNNPTIFDPYRAPFSEGGKSGQQRNRERQEDVLWLMKEQGMLSQEEYQAAMDQEMLFKSGIKEQDRLAKCPNTECGYKNTIGSLTVTDGKYFCPSCNTEIVIQTDSSETVYSWFTDTVLEDVAKAMAAQDGTEWNDTTVKSLYMQKIQKGGYNIYTTLDMDVQNQVDKIYTDYSQIPAVRGGQQLQSAIVVIDNRSGDIVAMSGGVGEKKIFDDWNRATDAKRQSGSAIKPLSIYGPAFESGVINPASIVTDLPLTYDEEDPEDVWPKNDDRVYRYSRTVLQAVVNSVNAVAANILKLTTPSYAFRYAKDQFGLSTLVESYIDRDGTRHTDMDYAPLAMGAQTWGVTVRDMASGFAVYSNKGIYREGRTFTKVYDSEGNLVLDNTQDSKQVVSEKTVNYMNYCMQNAVDSGTGWEAKLNVATAGKTGSAADNKDRWFCGFTGHYTAAIWCGFDSPAVINMISGNNPACQIWKKIMAPLHAGKENLALYDSTGLQQVEICLDSGLIATDACKNDIRADGSFSRVSKVFVYAEDVPQQTCNRHVNVHYCNVGGAAANEYCMHFAQVDSSVTIGTKSLVRMTREELDKIAKTPKSMLQGTYFEDDRFVYLVDKFGNDGVFTGIYKDLVQPVQAPYAVCSVHNKAAWDAFTQGPTIPNIPSTPTEPSDPVE